MISLEQDLQLLKSELVQMWQLVIGQLEKSRLALLEFDKDLARQVKANEKRVDAYELKLDMDCENILMLKNPVAIDLRFVLSVLKINYNLERIGDYANSFAKVAEKMEVPLNQDIIEGAHLPEMYFIAQSMLQESLNAFEAEDSKMVNGLFLKDKKLDDLNNAAVSVIEILMKANPDQIPSLLEAFTIVKKLERTGDHILNVAEELIFFFEATVVKHKKLSKKKKPGSA